jgi:hypothetical protein
MGRDCLLRKKGSGGDVKRGLLLLGMLRVIRVGGDFWPYPMNESIQSRFALFDIRYLSTIETST